MTPFSEWGALCPRLMKEKPVRIRRSARVNVCWSVGPGKEVFLPFPRIRMSRADARGLAPNNGLPLLFGKSDE
jgi:hypothetical protein